MSLIKCELVHYSLEDPPGYVAISYAWGDTDEKKRIQLEGAREKVIALSRVFFVRDSPSFKFSSKELLIDQPCWNLFLLQFTAFQTNCSVGYSN